MNKNRVLKLESKMNLISKEDQIFMDEFKNNKLPDSNMKIKALLVALKTKSLSKIVKEANLMAGS
jgi:hypothetical protein